MEDGPGSHRDLRRPGGTAKPAPNKGSGLWDQGADRTSTQALVTSSCEDRGVRVGGHTAGEAGAPVEGLRGQVAGEGGSSR